MRCIFIVWSQDGERLTEEPDVLFLTHLLRRECPLHHLSGGVYGTLIHLPGDIVDRRARRLASREESHLCGGVDILILAIGGTQSRYHTPRKYGARVETSSRDPTPLTQW